MTSAESSAFGDHRSSTFKCCLCPFQMSALKKVNVIFEGNEAICSGLDFSV